MNHIYYFYGEESRSHDFLFYSAPDKVYVLTTTKPHCYAICSAFSPAV